MIAAPCHQLFPWAESQASVRLWLTWALLELLLSLGCVCWACILSLLEGQEKQQLLGAWAEGRLPCLTISVPTAHVVHS